MLYTIHDTEKAWHIPFDEEKIHHKNAEALLTI